MKKLLTFFLTALLTIGVGWAAEETVTFSSLNFTNQQAIETVNCTNFTLVFNKGTNSNAPKYFTSGSAIRVYGGNTVTVSSENTITKIVITFGSNDGSNAISTDVGSYTNGTWTGSASNVVFTVGGSSGNRRFAAVTVTYTPSGPVEENWYRKVTSTSDLVAGKKYIIVNEASGAGMGVLNSSRFGTGVQGLSFENNRVDIGGTDVMEMTLGGSSNDWTFQMSNNNYLSDTSSDNYTFFSASSVQSSSTDITKWTITPSSSSCSIRSNYVTSQYIRYNTASGLFGTYGATAQSAVALYVEDDGTIPTPACEAPVFNPDGGVFTGSAQVTITSATEGATIYYTTDGTDPVVNRSSIANGGTVELTESCTLKAMAVKSGMDNSAIVTSQPYTITSGGDGNTNIYRKVTSTDDLIPGQKYIIMYENGNSSVGMGQYDGSKHFNGVQNLSISNNKVDIAGTNVLELTLGGTTGAWTLYTGSGFIQGANAVQFNIVGNATDNDSKWIITNSVANTNGFVVKNGMYERYIKCYNGATFRHYNSSTGTWAYLYVQDNNNNPELTISPETQTINDAAPAELTITGENVSGSINASLATTTDWYLNPNTFSNTGGTATLTYTGRALSASNTVTASANGATDATATVNYVADLFIVGDYGSGWDFNTGEPMSYNNGVYTATITTQSTAYIMFARKLGESNPWNTRFVFGPSSNGNWWLPADGNGSGSIDLYDDDPIYIQNAGIYTVTIDANAGTFTITKQTIDVTIMPADGTHFTGPTISGTITSNPAGTIEWSTDGTNWQAYTDSFTATVSQPEQSVTVYARSTYNGFTSDVTTATYTRDFAPAPDAPNFSIGGSAVPAGTMVTITAPEGCTLYVDGEQVSSPYTVTINAATTISAYCVNDEGTHSITVSNTYVIAAVCTADVVFKDSDNDSSSSTSWTAIGGEGSNNYFESGKDYFSGAQNVNYVYKGTTGLKFGNSSNGGSITFNLDGEFIDWKVSHITLNAINYRGNSVTFTVTTDNGQSVTTTEIGSTLGAGYTLDFDGSRISSITISSSARAYLKGFSITYDCAPEVEAPVITPATGTYYENQTVTITGADGTTIHYTTDGTEPTADSPVYNGPFTAQYVADGTTTIKAIAFDGQNNPSPVTEVTYTWGSPSVTITPGSRNTTASTVTVTLSGSPADAQVYYTTDGSTPTTESTLYDGPFSVTLDEIGSEATVNAIAVYSGLTSDVATATYTRVDKIIDVDAPFFSPLENQTYYGDQTLKIGCTTPNADIYYLIEEDGTAGEPSKTSIYYEGQTINMTVGHTYHVKAIAYIGNYASTISEGTYTIVADPGHEYTYATLKDFNDNCPTSVTAHFLNPVQVVYHSTYTNNGEFAEFCYLRDNTDYACVYFGKRDTHDYTIFEMGDWIDGSQIAGVTNIWDRNFHIQLGTGSHEVTSWPTQIIGKSKIIPEEMTNDVIVAGTADGDNVWGHYVHLRNCTLSNVADYSANDPKHTGLVNDGTADVYYYDKFYRWSAGTCSYTTGGNTYNDPIQCLGDYDQAFFTQKQDQGATFDVYGIVDYYSQYTPPFEMCPIDFLWAYKPTMTPATTTSYEPITVDITATQPEWAAEGVVIYYRTDDMEEWAVYSEPILVNSTTTVQAYAEVSAEKTDGTNYNDMVRSEIISETYTIEGINDPTISPESKVVEVVSGQERVIVTITDNNEVGSGAVTTFTVNDAQYTLQAGESVQVIVSETTTVTAVSSIVSGEHTVYSNTVTETYTFARSNGIEYYLLKTAPVVGNIYVIVNKAANMGMSNSQNDSNRGSTGVLFKENTNKEVVYGNDDIAQFVLEQVSGNRYYFKSLTGDGGYLCVETNDNANLVTTASHDASGYDVATVTVGENNADVDMSYPATITFTYEGTVRTMRYYANGRTFSTYADGNLNEDVFLYGAQVTPLHVIERDFETSTSEQVTVSDRLIGVWAAKNILWAKDQNYASIDATSKRDDQLDYVRMAKLKTTQRAFQPNEWEQSNWVMLDFSNTDENPMDYVGYEFDNNSIVGYYVDDLNYRIELLQAPSKGKLMAGYPGFNGDPVDLEDNHTLNHYVSSNFYEPNLNWNNNTGYWYEGSFNGQSLDTCIFFMNPKICEIAQVWAVWNAEQSQFTIYEREGFDINGYDLDGAFNMTPDNWMYNHFTTASGLTDDQAYGSVQSYLIDDAYYIFHVAIMRSNDNYGHRKSSTPSGKRNAVAKDSNATSNSMMVYPLDLTITDAQTPPTAVREIVDYAGKTVDSVRYYNMLGIESKEPFEGINIVVTRYTDGTFSTVKVLK